MCKANVSKFCTNSIYPKRGPDSRVAQCGSGVSHWTDKGWFLLFTSNTLYDINKPKSHSSPYPGPLIPYNLKCTISVNTSLEFLNSKLFPIKIDFHFSPWGFPCAFFCTHALCRSSSAVGYCLRWERLSFKPWLQPCVHVYSLLPAVYPSSPRPTVLQSLTLCSRLSIPTPHHTCVSDCFSSDAAWRDMTAWRPVVLSLWILSPSRVT